jgi:coenzyme F420-reducing hydrogenase delta subunit
MGDGPDGLLVSQARQQPVKCHFKYASFDLYRRLSRLTDLRTSFSSKSLA